MAKPTSPSMVAAGESCGRVPAAAVAAAAGDEIVQDERGRVERRKGGRRRDRDLLMAREQSSESEREIVSRACARGNEGLWMLDKRRRWEEVAVTP